MKVEPWHVDSRVIPRSLRFSSYVSFFVIIFWILNKRTSINYKRYEYLALNNFLFEYDTTNFKDIFRILSARRL